MKNDFDRLRETLIEKLEDDMEVLNKKLQS